MTKESKDFYYLESSAALAWLLQEVPFEKILQKLENAEEIFASILTSLEVSRVLSRTIFGDDALRIPEAKVFGALENSIKKWNLMDLTSDIQKRVAAPFPVEPVRTQDAIHLASAMEFAKSHSDLKVLTLDKRIILNLQPLGLELAEL